MLRDGDVEAVKSAVNMPQLAETYGFRVNRNGFMLCPFHADKSPSLKVYPGYMTGDGYHCYSCGAGGDIIRFAMEYEGLDFEAAVRRIAGMFGVPISDGAELTAADKAKIAERKRQLEQKRRQEAGQKRALLELADRIRWYEQLTREARPYGELWCYLANRLPVMQGEWEARFNGLDDRPG